MSPNKLSLEEGTLLVRTGRTAITEYIQSKRIIKVPNEVPEHLRRKSGVFVTLNKIEPVHELRGCIGFPYPVDTLINSTIRAAIYAATEDPRFPPVSLEEFKASITIELTALTQPQVLKAQDRKTLPNMIQVGRHGLIVEGMGTSGLLLPQVATEWNWDASEFLMNCCLKADLPPDSWLLDGVEVKVFEGEIFEELEPAGKVRRKATGED
ncbi:MAG: TIGR00296 family protein [Candidatus Bathyarchaeia archaeon]